MEEHCFPFLLQMHRSVLHTLKHLQQDLVNLLHGLNFLGCFTKQQSYVSMHNSYTAIITLKISTTELSINSSKHCSKHISLYFVSKYFSYFTRKSWHVCFGSIHLGDTNSYFVMPLLFVLLHCHMCNCQICIVMNFVFYRCVDCCFRKTLIFLLLLVWGL